MLEGVHTYQVDQKARFFAPVEWRGDLREGGWMTRGLEPCLVIFPLKKWTAILKRLNRLPFTDPKVRAVQRYLSIGEKVKLDTQNRLMIPPTLRAYAGIAVDKDKENDLFLVGLGDRAEIWSKAVWDEYDRTQLSSQAVIEQAASLVF